MAAHSRVKVIKDQDLTDAYQKPHFIAICGECGEMGSSCDTRESARDSLDLTSCEEASR